jgi:hypothetical protein
MAIDLQEEYPKEIGYDQLTDWKNEPKVDDLKADLTEAQPHHDLHCSRVERWLDNLYVRGSAKHKKKEGRSSITPKLIRKQAEWRYAALSEPFLAQENIFTTEPFTWEDRKRAEQAGLVLNYQWNTQLDKVKFIDDYVRTLVDEGTAIVRVGWNFQEEEVLEPNYVETPAKGPQALAIIQTVGQLQENPELLEELPEDLRMDVEATIKNQTPTDVVRRGSKMVKRIVKDHPTAEVCEYDAVIVDPSCKGDFSKAQFIIQQFETSLSDLEKSEIEYKNLDNIDVEKASINGAGVASEADEKSSSFNFADRARKKFFMYEYWGYWDIDDDGKTEPFVATWVGDTMIRLEKSPYPDQGLPFVGVQYLPRRKEIYGEPDGELLEDNQKISGAVTRGMLDIMGRAAVGQTGIQKDLLDVTNMRRFERGEDFYFNPMMNPEAGFWTSTYPDIPQSAPFMLELQNQDAEALTGVKAFHGGISGEGLGRSATAARGALDAASKREVGILRRLAQGMIEIARKHIAMNAVMLEENAVVRITNDDYVSVSRDDLASRADVKLDISTAETDNAKAQELAFMLQTMGPNQPFEITQKVMARIAKLRNMPDLARELEEYRPEPDPMQEELQQLELAKLQAEIQKLESEAAENFAEAEKDQADARLSSSKADNEDLNFVEEQSGIKHQRELDKTVKQAEAQAGVETVKSQLSQPGQQPISPEGEEPFF